MPTPTFPEELSQCWLLSRGRALGLGGGRDGRPSSSWWPRSPRSPPPEPSLLCWALPVSLCNTSRPICSATPGLVWTRPSSLSWMDTVDIYLLLAMIDLNIFLKINSIHQCLFSVSEPCRCGSLTCPSMPRLPDQASQSMTRMRITCEPYEAADYGSSRSRVGSEVLHF